MSKGLIAALGIAVIIVGALLAYIPASNYALVNLHELDGALAGASSDERQHTEAEYYQARCADSISSGFLPLKDDARATVEHNRTAYTADQTNQKAEYPNYCDLAAQYRSAAAAESSKISAWGVLGLTAIGVLLLFLTLLATTETLNQARLATEAANATTEVTRQIGEQAEKAFIVVESASRGKLNQFDCSFRHLGKTTAFGVHVDVAYTVFINGHPFREEETWFRRAFILPTDPSIEECFDFQKIKIEIEDQFGPTPQNGMHRLEFTISYIDVFSFGSLRSPNITKQIFQSNLAGCGPMLCISTYSQNSENTEVGNA